jgi:hypothetical protein
VEKWVKLIWRETRGPEKSGGAEGDTGGDDLAHLS